MRPEGSVQPRPIQADPPSTVDVVGVPLALIDYDQTLDWIESMVAEGERGYVCVCNLYGGRNQGALVQLALNLRQRYPGVKIVGGYSPPHRPLTVEERKAVADEINHSRADVVWVGIGVPKQEKWMAQMRPLLETPVLVGVGAAFDFHAGLVQQAPPWMQSAGLEWAYRLTREPRRLWRRYLRYNPRFVGAFALQLTKQLRRTQRRS
jgi:N-acetylglucosaminyldiphosphoundecaprenol N-acetyl-beta-D-mannosaminyltransferase